MKIFKWLKAKPKPEKPKPTQKIDLDEIDKKVVQRLMMRDRGE